jgi:ActR/RegA family two-component response regulator
MNKREEQVIENFQKELREMGSLTSRIAHDVNNLLTGILANIWLAKKCVEPGGEIFTRLDAVEKASIGAKDLTQQLLAIATDNEAYPIPDNNERLQTVCNEAIKPDSNITNPSVKSPKPGKKKVLIMEDSEIITKSINNCLADLDFQIEFAGEGQVAISKYKTAYGSGYPFSAVLIDLTIIGGLGGKETIAKLLEIDPDVRAIATSGYASNGIMLKPEKFGFKGALPKPYGIDELNEVLNSILRL